LLFLQGLQYSFVKGKALYLTYSYAFTGDEKGVVSNLNKKESVAEVVRASIGFKY